MAQVPSAETIGPAASSPPSRVAGPVFLLLPPVGLAIAVFYLLYEFLLSTVEGDQAFYLYAAKRMLSGVQLDGPRLIETNPPLILWFSEIPVGIAGLLHASPVLMLRVVVLSILAASILWCMRIFRRTDLSAKLGRGMVSVAAISAVGFVELTIRPAEFGQREHLLVALLMPYVLAAASGESEAISRMERMAIGLSAGLAVCFKPHHVVTLFCLELFLLIYNRSARRLISPELIAAAFTGVAYLAAVRFFTPAYLVTILPLLTDTYWALGQHTFGSMVLHVERTSTLAFLLVAIGWLVVRGRLKTARVSGALLACSFGGLIALDIQHTGWYHQTFPATAFLLLAALWIAIDLLAPDGGIVPSGRPWNSTLLPAAVVVGIALFAVAAVHHRREANRAQPQWLNSELATYPPNTSVYVFAVEMNQFPVILDRGLIWSSRFADLWMVPAIIENQTASRPAGRPFKELSPERVNELASLVRAATAEDLRSYKPDYIFVERCAIQPCDAYSNTFDDLAWFSEDPAFAAEWSHYTLEKSVVHFDVYTRRH